MSHKPCVLGPAALPGNSQYTYLWDSTRGLVESLSAGASLSAPGTLRGMWAGRRFHGLVDATTQNVTVLFYRLKKPTGTTNAAWEQDSDAPGGGTNAVTAGTPFYFNYMPTSADCMGVVQAGATAPSALSSQTVIEHQRTSGT